MTGEPLWLFIANDVNPGPQHRYGSAMLRSHLRHSPGDPDLTSLLSGLGNE